MAALLTLSVLELIGFFLPVNEVFVQPHAQRQIIALATLVVFTAQVVWLEQKRRSARQFKNEIRAALRARYSILIMIASLLVRFWLRRGSLAKR